jgi:hypothetical protein
MTPVASGLEIFQHQPQVRSNRDRDLVVGV